MARRTFYAGVALASAATLLAGCGAQSAGSGAGGTGAGANDSSQPPAAELASAVNAVSNSSTASVTVRLGLTPSQVQGLANSGGDMLSPAQSRQIAGIKVTVQVSAPSGKTLAQAGNAAAVAMTVSDNGTSYLSFRVVDKTVYIQANLADLLKAFGKGQLLAGLEAESANLPAFVQALVAGKWVSISQDSLKQLSEVLGATPPPTPPASAPGALTNALRSVLAKDTTVRRTSAGTTDDLTITGNTRRILRGLIGQLRSLVPGSGVVLAHLHPRVVPAKRLTVKAQVTGGALSELSVNVTQLAPRKTQAVPLVVTITRGGAPVTAPSGAVPVTLPPLGALLGGLGGLGGLHSLLGGAGGLGQLGGLGLSS
jgi:hypothetical protein